MKRQRYMKMTAALLALLLIFVPAAYASSGAAGAAETSQGVITAITDGDGLPVESSYAVTVSAGDSGPLDEFLWKMLRVYAAVEGETAPVTLDVDWDYNSLLDGLDTPGVYTHTASIPADGHTFADGVPQSVTVVITVTEATAQEQDVIMSFDDLENRYAYAVALGSDWQEFWDSYMSGGVWEDSWPCHTEDGETLYADIAWEDPLPDMSQAGVVTVRGTAVLPENAVPADGAALPTVEVPVSIQAEPTLECWCADAYVVYIPWVMGELENEDSLRYLASVDGGEWEDAGEWIDTNGESVCVWTAYLEEGSTYQVKAVWDTGQTNAFQFDWNGAVTNAGGVEGDRDGGDSGGNPADDISQPAPDAPQSEPGSENGSDSETSSGSENGPDTRQENGSGPDSETASSSNDKPKSGSDTRSAKDSGLGSETASASAASSAVQKKSFTEEVTGTYNRLSGTRLAMMRQTGAVRFSKQGVTVTLSDAALDAMELTDDSRFLIEVKKTKQGFSLAVTLDGEAVTALPDTLVQVPFTPTDDDSSIVLLDEQGSIVCYGVYDAETGIVSFTIHGPGRYTIMETGDETAMTSKTSAGGTSAPEQKTELSGLLLPVIILSLAAFLTGLFCFRRRLR